MSVHRCEKCSKEFNSRSHYTQHCKRKTSCIKVDSHTPSPNLESIYASTQMPIQTRTPTSPTPTPNIDAASFEELRKYYDEVLNTDKSSYKSSNDEPTPINCIIEMISKLPIELWSKPDLSILDPCCGNGNFFIPIIHELLKHHHTKSTILENILEFNDINETRLNNVRRIFGANEKYKLQVSNQDFMTFESLNPGKTYDLSLTNPPYAKMLENGQRASKNHNLIKDFIEKSLIKL
jgi:hypothetical protein